MTISKTITDALNHMTVAAVTAGVVLVGGVGAPQDAHAADVEVYFSNASTSTAKPNVLFILDTSQSMYTVETTALGTYDPLRPYPNGQGGCAGDKYYWATAGDLMPDCKAADIVGISSNNFQCTRWKDSVNRNGFQTGLPLGSSPSRVAQAQGSRWSVLDQQDKVTACQGDAGNSGPNAWGPITPGSYTFYSGNYINFFRASNGESKYRIDIVREVVGRLANNTSGVKMGLMRYGYDGARVLTQNTPTACLDAWNPDESQRSGNGAPIVYPVTDVEGAGIAGHVGANVRAQFQYELGLNASGTAMGYLVNPSLILQPQRVVPGGGSNCPIPLFTPGGRSPIGGGMHEAYLYYAGKEWSQKFGKQNSFGSGYNYPSVPSSRVNGFTGGEQYKSPITDGCAKNFIILLSDGTTEQDNDVDGPVESLPNFAKATGRGRCDDEPYLTGTPPPSKCVDDMAHYMFESDLSPTIPGIQNVTTYTVGFKLGNDGAANSARNLLKETAQRGGGTFNEAQDAASLEIILVDLVRQILLDNATFTAPGVAVNAFNRTENLDDLYISLFRPALNVRWRGNVKKYKIQTDPNSAIQVGEIIDATGTQAVNPATGFFRDSARSYWTDPSILDGGDVTLGGAQSKVDYAGRKVYSNLGVTAQSGGTALNVSLATIAANEIEAVKAYAPADGRNALGLFGSDSVSVSALVDWMRGMDIDDIDGDGILAEDRYNFGDPLHSRPVLAIYGGTAAAKDINDSVLYVTTNDGYLHAINPVTGAEWWAFVPYNQLNRARNLFYNAAATPVTRGYGLDGVIRLVQVDTNFNGVIETTDGDKVYLFFGQRRGGSWLYGLDVTDKTKPVLMWALNSAHLPGAGQSWSTPQPTRVNIGGVSTPVLFFGGGYPPATQDQLPYSTDATGNRIFMIHALTGALLWSAGPTGSGATLQLAAMNNAFAAPLSVVDLSGDGQADRLYAADLGGRIWRFDIFNSKPVAGLEGQRLIEGGLFASLGNAEDTTRTQANSLRFFGQPDAAILSIGASRFLNIAIGSGHREFPVTDLLTVNWAFGVRDYRILGTLLSSQYRTTACPTDGTPCHRVITEDALADLTSVVGTAATAAVPIGSPGWRIRLGVTGEKVLGETVTLQGTLLFTTYAPETLGQVGSSSCAVRFGTNRVYRLSATDARPRNNQDNPTSETPGARGELLAATGTIAPPPTLVFPPVRVNCIGVECRPRPIAYCGLEVCGGGLPSAPVRTFWRQRGVE